MEGTNEYELFIADFGIGLKAATAKTKTSRIGSQLPLRTTRLLGSCTQDYASPQQLAGAVADQRDDIYAIGVIWYQLLVGDATKRMPPDYQRKLDPRIIGEDFLTLLGDCVASDREDRIKDASALSLRLDECLKLRRCRSCKEKLSRQRQHEEAEQQRKRREFEQAQARHVQRKARAKRTLAIAVRIAVFALALHGWSLLLFVESLTVGCGL